MMDESPRRVQARRGFSVFYRGKPLLSTIDPIARAEKAVRAARIMGRTLYVVSSPLLGYGIRALLDAISTDSAVLCIECDDSLFDFTLKEMDSGLLNHPRLRLVKTRSPEQLCAYVRKEWGPRSFRRLEPLCLGEGRRIFEETYDRLIDALGRELSLDWSNAMTLTRLGRLYARNALRNLPLLATSRDLSTLRFGSAPLLVLGAGPSLDGTLSSLASLMPSFFDPETRNFRIVTVDTALPAIRSRGIREDLTIALEAQHWNLRDFVGIGPGPSPIAMDLSSLPATAQIARRDLYLFSTPWTSLRLLKRLEDAELLPRRLPPLGSVGLTAVAAALAATEGPVFVAGVDFAFRPDSYHAKATPGHAERLRYSNRLKSVIDPGPAYGPRTFEISGKDDVPLRSDPALRGYRDLFEREYGREERLIDIGTCGLDLGIPRMSVENAAAVLAGGTSRHTSEAMGRKNTGDVAEVRRGNVEVFIREEIRRAETLRDILSGTLAPGAESLDELLDACDYLWAHFPECAAAEGRRPAAGDLSFLKRVRAELGPFLKTLDLALADITRPST